jgi:hypothetical protein
MSFLYRPTPVVNFGRGQFASQAVSFKNAPGGVMHGVDLDANYKRVADALRRVPSGNPWITASGTMGEFVPNGLGGFGLGDDTSDLVPPDFYGGVDMSPNIPAFTPDIAAPDLGSPTFSPTAPVFSDPGIGVGPSIPFSLPAPGSLQTTDSPLSSTLTPPGAGATGTGIPGTQPLNVAALQAQANNPFSSIANAIGSIFKPKPVVPAGYTALPGYGGVQTTPSFGAWFRQPSALLPATSNGTLILAGVAVVVLLGAMKAAR